MQLQSAAIMEESIVGKRVGEGMTVPATSGRAFSVDSAGSPRTVLYFYPKDDTPGCIIEAGEFRDLHDRFRSASTTVWGVSRDDLASHERFRAKLSLPFELISDETMALCEAFHTITWRKLYGRVTPIARRCTFLLDGEGRVIREWRDVPYEGHAASVLAAAEQARHAP